MNFTCEYLKCSIFELSKSVRKHRFKCVLFSLKFAKIVGDWGSTPDPAGGAYSTPPEPLVAMGWDRDFVPIPGFTDNHIP